jgi:hypothetical protein
MSSQHDSLKTAATQEQVIRLPAAKQTSAASVPAGQPRTGVVLTLLLLSLAFLAASFAVRNADLWFHLASGRLLAQGHYTFGDDPFLYTAEGVYWANHAWLFDLVLYKLYGSVGGTGLIVLKAFLITALAGMLLCVRRPGSTAGLPILCTALAVVALSPHLLLQPVCVSYVFLGLTLWLLWRQQAAESKSPRGVWPLLALFAFWANLDEWFWLGPLTAGLFWLGDRLQGARRISGWVVPAGLAACLLNPHTFHVFALPPELSPVSWSAGLVQDVRYQGQFGSPWPDYVRAAMRLDASVIAYAVLFVLGICSFIACPGALRSWRVLIWLCFALPTLWREWAIPFFVIVAAPITVLNWQDFAASRDQKSQTRRLPSILRPALFLAPILAGLLFLTWTGWLAGSDREERHVGWELRADPSLRQAAETLQKWREAGLLPEDVHVFATSTEASQVSAWFCPDVKQFFDHRYPLSPQAGRDYEIVCRALLPDLAVKQPRGAPAARERATSWQQVLRDRGVGILVFHDHEPQRLFAVLGQVAEDPETWTLLHVAGQALIVGWNEGQSPETIQKLAFDAARSAFGPNQATVPDKAPDPLPSRPDFMARLAPGSPALPPWESAAATMYLGYYLGSEGAERQLQFRSLCAGFAASLAGVPALPTGLPQALYMVYASEKLLLPRDASRQILVRTQLGPYFASFVERSPALPLLAVRAARRAVAANPGHASAWLRLGQAYSRLRNDTCERSAEGMLPPLSQLRMVQIVTALEQACRLDPKLREAHFELARLYGERFYLDQALVHFREETRLAHQAGRRPGESVEEYSLRLETLDKDLAKLEAQVQDLRTKYDMGSLAVRGDPRAQADLALKLGHPRLAVEEVLYHTNPDVLSAAGIRLQLDLMLAMGRADEVRTTLADKGVRASKHNLRYYDIVPPGSSPGASLYALPYHWPAYEWLHALEAAALGDYAQARAALAAIRADVRAAHTRLHQHPRDLQRDVVRHVPGLFSGPPRFLSAFTYQIIRGRIEDEKLLEWSERSLRAQQADLLVLEALLALEQGDTQAARAGFLETDQLCGPAAGTEVPFGAKPIVSGYLGKLRATE